MADQPLCVRGQGSAQQDNDHGGESKAAHRGRPRLSADAGWRALRARLRAAASISPPCRRFFFFFLGLAAGSPSPSPCAFSLACAFASRRSFCFAVEWMLACFSAANSRSVAQ